MDRAHIGPVFGVSEETFLLERLLNKLGPTRLGWKSLGPPFPFWSWLDPVRGPRPIVDLGILPLQVVTCIYSTIETLHQMKYLQPSTMKILLSILPSLLSYFMSLTTMFSLLNF